MPDGAATRAEPEGQTTRAVRREALEESQPHWLGAGSAPDGSATHVFPSRDGDHAAPSYPVEAPQSYPAQPTRVLPQDARTAAPATSAQRAPAYPGPTYAEQPTRVDGGLAPYAQPGRPTPSSQPGDHPDRSPAGYWPGAGAPSDHELGFPGGFPDGHLPGGPQQAPTWAVPPRRRTLTVAGVGLGLSAAAAPFPGIFLVITAVLLVITSTTGWSGRSRRSARLRRGRRSGDDARMLAGLPWHLLRGVLSVLPGAILGSLAGAATWWLGSSATFAPDPAVVEATVRSGAGLVTLLVAWLTPTSRVAREGARAMVDVLTPTRGFRTLLVVLVLGVASVVALQLLLGASPTPLWSPLPDPAEFGI
ncbi:hypothetical protein [Georgenia subflava]|uniref:Uncharacterized protein n=3 Tax=Georgenia subflava TaxID=1622177 RepID=A0A6N7ERM2_9MICO|nr:hypothetical protein [Georgenia subflava]MPV39185.1 hypothetical protein [Georgenia subflava]